MPVGSNPSSNKGNSRGGGRRKDGDGEGGDGEGGDNKNEVTGEKSNGTTVKDGKRYDASGNEIKWDSSRSWVSFIKSLFIYFLLTLLFGVFGSSFIYLTTRGSDLDIILPTNEEFYTAPKFESQKYGPYSDVNCKETSLDKFTVLQENFPYNMIKAKGSSKAELQNLSFVQRLTNWFAKTVAGCFKTNRAILKDWLDNFTPNTPMGNHTFQIYIGFPFTIIFSFVALLTGFGAAFGSAVSADMKVTVWGGFLIYAWSVCIGLSMLIFLRLIGTICFLPMSQNWKEVANIMACNVKALVVLFGFFVCGSAYATLDPSIAGIMGVVYIALVGFTVFRYFSKQL